MVVGDLVTGRYGEWLGSLGAVLGFDEDNDPIVRWIGQAGSNEAFPGCGEYRKELMVVTEEVEE